MSQKRLKMAKRSNYLMSTEERMRRTFSEEFKKKKVKDIELGILQVCDIKKEYQVSTTSIYRWIAKFGTMKKKERVVLETDSDTKRLIELRRQLADLERIIGQKQVLIDFQSKMIDLAEETYGIDIKKKFSSKPSD
jgi:transposase-like protein